MSDLLQISPSGNILVTKERPQSDKTDNAPKHRKIEQIFERSTPEGLFYIATHSSSESDASLSFWKEFTGHFVESLCRIPDFTDADFEVKAPSIELLQEIVAKAPPMIGIEYLNTDVLVALWNALTTWTRENLERENISLSEWLKLKAPKWRQVGRVCFHLAENKKDAEYPFAFMATYAPCIASDGKLKFLPLGQALKEYADTKNKAMLTHLLLPVHEASKRLSFVGQLIESGDIYHPMAWTPSEAHRFLQSIPILEESGLLTRLPNWWQSRKRAQASISIGDNSKSFFGANALLSFRAQIAVGDKNLNQEEIDALMEGEDGLVRLNGEWVEVDKEKLQQALDHWQRVEAEAADGNISFTEGMRLLAGANINLPHNRQEPSELDEIQQWSNVKASDWLDKTLQDLHSPDRIINKAQPKQLKAKLRPYQKDGFNWLSLLTNLGLGAILADDMGLGKTIQIIALLLSEKEASGKKTKTSSPKTSSPPSLLILPASLLGNWKSEFEKFAPSLRLAFVHPSETDKKTIERYAENPAAFDKIDVVITTYGMVLRQSWLSTLNWKRVILDEAQAIKNSNTRQTKAVKAIKSESRIALTGTPVENKLSDLWSLFDFACPGLLGTSGKFSKFAQSLKNDETHKYAPLKKLIAPYILRRLKTDKKIISDLPDKTEVKAYCTLEKKQAALYQKVVKQLQTDLSETDEGIGRRGLVLSVLTRLKQICNHPSQALADNIYAPEASGKFKRLAQLCEEIAARQEKVLIFTQYREMTEPIAKYLETIFHRPGLVLHGGTPIGQRKKFVDSFQNENGPPFFVLSLKAGGTGLTLTAASHVIHFDRWWNPAVENQATDRAFRIGQKKNVIVHKFISRGTLEEKVDKLIDDKLALSQSLLQKQTEANLTELSDAELLKLISLDLNTIA